MIYNRPKALVATGADFRRPVRLSTELTKWTGDIVFFFFQAEDGIRDLTVTVQTCALPILRWRAARPNRARISGSTRRSSSQASASAAGARGGTISPVAPTIAAESPTSVATQGTPQAMA